MQEQRKREAPFLIILDNVEDPHNLGAIIRTANLAGAHGVIIPKRRAVGLTSTVAKTSAGATQLYTSCQGDKYCKNNERQKASGLYVQIWTERYVCTLIWTGPIGLVIGNEGEWCKPSCKREM